MQAEVGFDDVYGPAGWWITQDPTEGGLAIAVCVLVLVTMTPRLLRPMLANVLSPEATSHLAIPDHREQVFLTMIGVAAFGAVVHLAAAQLSGDWSYLSVGPVGIVREFATGGLMFRWALSASALFGAATLVVSVAQLTADARFGSGFGALVLVGGVLSAAIVWATGQPLFWLAIWFPICASVAFLCRIISHPAWLVICCIGVPTLVLTVAGAAFAIASGLVEWLGIVWNVAVTG